MADTSARLLTDQIVDESKEEVESHAAHGGSGELHRSKHVHQVILPMSLYNSSTLTNQSLYNSSTLTNQSLYNIFTLTNHMIDCKESDSL